MKYKNASSLLPAALVEQLQDYLQGEYLYIPKKEDQHKSWGDQTGSRLGSANAMPVSGEIFSLGSQ